MLIILSFYRLSVADIVFLLLYLWLLFNLMLDILNRFPLLVMVVSIFHDYMRRMANKPSNALGTFAICSKQS